MKPLLLIPNKSYSQAAVDFAGLLAKKANTPLTLLYAGKRESDREAGEEFKEQAGKQLKGIDLTTEIIVGDQIESLHSVVASHGIDVVIVGETENGGFLGLSVDPIVDKVVFQSPVPVIEVHHPVERLERFLICTGGTERANDAIETGSLLASKTGAQTTLLYVTGTVPSMYTGLDQMDETLQEILDTDTPLSRHLHHGAEIMERYNLKAKLELRHGVPSDTIITSAESGDYDLIVLGASRVGKNLRNWLLGNVSKQVIERTNIPVMVVHIGQSIS